MELQKQSTCIIGNREWYKRPLCTTKVHIYLNVATHNQSKYTQMKGSGFMPVPNPI